MSNASDPMPLVTAFLEQVAIHADQVPDPFAGDPVAPHHGNPCVPSLALRGQIARIVEDERDLRHAFARHRGEAVQAAIDRGFKSTADEGVQLALYKQLEADIASRRERWYSGLQRSLQVELDSYCLCLTDRLILDWVPRDLPHCLRPSLARLGIEYAALVRRAAQEREERSTSLALRHLANPTVASSIMGNAARLEEEARSRLVGRWLREVSQGQPTDSKRDTPASTLPVSPRKGKTKRGNRKKRQSPSIPPNYKEAVKLWPAFKKELEKLGKRATIDRFREWLKKRKRPILLDDKYDDWWNDIYSPQVRRRDLNSPDSPD